MNDVMLWTDIGSGIEEVEEIGAYLVFCMAFEGLGKTAIGHMISLLSWIQKYFIFTKEYRMSISAI